jgi:hypothetical protein
MPSAGGAQLGFDRKIQRRQHDARRRAVGGRIVEQRKASFGLEHQLEHVDTIFARVFGTAS